MLNKINIGSKVRFKQDDRLYERLYVYLDGYDVRKVISPDSPVGQAMLGKSAGDKFEAHTPGGVAEIEILEVK